MGAASLEQAEATDWSSEHVPTGASRRRSTSERRRRRSAAATVVELAPQRSGGPAGVPAMAKRALDILVALALLLAVLPVLVAVTIAVKASSRGPVLFRQTRVGRGGRTFSMLKFRSFPVDHVDRVQSLAVDQCPLRVGRLIRRTSIDELPQLLNVLAGHMSLVGPRPERPAFAVPLAAEIPEYRDRHRVAAGITGHAQVLGLVGPTSIEDRVAADNDYIDRWSFRRDLAILLRTLPTVVRKFRV